MAEQLKKILREHLQQRQLSDEQLLRFGIQPEAETPAAPLRKSSWLWLAGSAASVLLVFLLVLLAPLETADLPQRIAEEVVINHLKQRPLEVKANRLNQLDEYFNELEFALTNSRMLAGNELLGGRYCSLQGRKAAQLRYQQDKHRPTLYQVAYDSTLFGKLPDINRHEAPLKIFSRGIAVSIWVEKGVLFAMTQQPVEE